MSNQLVDGAQRSEALIPDKSYIVQAPAGSGKTGLLVQRILALLARVDNPEEVLAITFTRKAASEMQNRIIEALGEACSDIPPEEGYKQLTWELARAALANDKKNGWDLHNNPGRLRIMTIDSLCANLVSQMPLLSKYGSMPAVIEDASELYETAAKHTIDLLNEDTVWTHSVRSLAMHLDNRLDYIMSLICNMLAKRDQWLRHVADPDHPSIDRQNMEQAFRRMIERYQAELVNSWPDSLKQETLDLARFSAANLKYEIQLEYFPETDASHLTVWKFIADLLLTKEGKLREKVDKRQGFPAKTTANTNEEERKFVRYKERMAALLVELHDFQNTVEKLHRIRLLPVPEYSEPEWEIMQALFEILRISVAQLELVFGETGSVDFTSISQAALRALGAHDAPTDLALSLDYKISHILVDEFQDTALPQLSLLKSLTAGWQEGDGNTIFIVGDPMQSIYRFREAEVGLFLEVWNSGIGDISLIPLQLKINFRSQAGIIEWINSHFCQVLPATDSLESGAVKYVESIATKNSLPGVACNVYPYFERDELLEAEQIRQIVTEVRRESANESIAILVRGRTHLASIISTLNEAELKYRAVELEGLGNRPVIQDLQALLKALYSLSDKVAWYGVLRAPWCGLKLNDLLQLAEFDTNKTIPELLADESCRQQLSSDGRERVKRLSAVMNLSLASMYTLNLREWLEGTWIMLGGPACLTDKTDLEDAEIFFQQLEKLDKLPVYKIQTELNKSLAKLFSLPDVDADDSLQIMTIHKSKGLEFDVVILPGLGYKPANNDSDLIKWLEYPCDPDGTDLLMAPIRQSGSEHNPKYQLLSDFEKQKNEYENGRLLYVAVTRAKKYLHIFGHVSCRKQAAMSDLARPASGSLLKSLWPAVENTYKQHFSLLLDQVDESNDVLNEIKPGRQNLNLFSRLDNNWQLPEPPVAIDMADRLVRQDDTLLEFDWAGESARITGIAIHEVLNNIVKMETIVSTDQQLPILLKQARYSLLNSGVGHTELEYALNKVDVALQNILEDPRGRWILDSRHIEQASEYALTGLDGNSLKHIVLDRTFIDEHGVRWIIDYKTGSTAGNKEEFMDREQERYHSQLHTYANILSHLDTHPIKLGLYFPMFQGWREWDYSDNTS